MVHFNNFQRLLTSCYRRGGIKAILQSNVLANQNDLGYLFEATRMVARSFSYPKIKFTCVATAEIFSFLCQKKHIKRTIIVASGSSFAHIKQDANNHKKTSCTHHPKTQTMINHFTLGNLLVIVLLSSSIQTETLKHL